MPGNSAVSGISCDLPSPPRWLPLYIVHFSFKGEIMSLLKSQIQAIELTLKTSLRNKFRAYHSEPAVMPFHARLLGKDKLVLNSFMRYFNKSFNSTIFAAGSSVIAGGRWPECLI